MGPFPPEMAVKYKLDDMERHIAMLQREAEARRANENRQHWRLRLTSAALASTLAWIKGALSRTGYQNSRDFTRRTAVFIQRIEESPKNRRGGGQVSHLLLGPQQFGSSNLAVTWVEGTPGSQQCLHAHPDREQVYVIVGGRGLMIVDNEESEVRPGSLVFIPPGTLHAIRNPGPERLVYVSATSPPFEMPEGEFAYESASPSAQGQ